MDKKILYIIFIELLIYACLSISNICYGGTFDFVASEVEGNVEPVAIPSAPPGDPGPGYTPEDTPPTSTEPEEPTANISIPTSIQGVVFEDLDRLEKENDGSMAGTYHLTNNFVYDSGEEPTVQGVLVEDGVSTDSSGRYSISGAGNHNITFTYGRQIDGNNYRLNQNTLKYNGQDYNIVVMGEGMSHYDKNYLRKIKEIEKSYTEVYIVIDHSASMRETDESGQSRINIVKESAVNFVNELFEKAEGNLAVGYIAFGYESVIVKKPTDIKEDVIHAIKNFKVENGVGKYSGAIASNFSSLNHRVGTNIGGAVLKAKDSYLSGKSNKVMILFSDGAATAHDGVESLYVHDTDEMMQTKLDQVAILTKADLKTVVSSDITLINILNQTEGTERVYVEKSFKDGASWIGNYYEVNYLNAEAVQDTLLNDTINIIEETESEFINYTDEKTFSGDDDSERRKEVNKYYDEFYYENLKLFEVIDKLNGTESNDTKVLSEFLGNENKESSDRKKLSYETVINGENNDLKKFIDNSWMKSTSNSVELYSVSRDSSGKATGITGGSGLAYQFEYYTNDEGVECCTITDNMGTGLSGDYKASNVTINEVTITLDAALIRRDEFKLSLDKIITGVKLTLSDGTVLYNELSDNAPKTIEKNKQFKELYCKQLQKNNGLIDEVDMSVKNLVIDEVSIGIPEEACLIVDTDLLQGAMLEVEYTLIIRNNSKNATFSKGFSIVDYFDNGLIYESDNELLTEEGVNEDYNWRVLEKEDMNELPYFSQNVRNLEINKILYVDFNQNEYNKKENIPSNGDLSNFETNSKYINPIIGNNGERYVKVVLSRVLSAELLEEFCYKNQAEIIKYKDNNSRRINWMDLVGTSVSYKYPISGNYVPTSFLENLPSSFTHINEIDTAVSKAVRLVPPSGEEISHIDKRFYYIPLVIISYFCIRKIIKRKH